MIDKQFGKIQEAKSRLEMITNHKGVEDEILKQALDELKEIHSSNQSSKSNIFIQNIEFQSKIKLENKQNDLIFIVNTNIQT